MRNEELYLNKELHIMKNKNIYIIVLSVLLSCLTSCKLENSHNGKLDGYWKLRTIENLQTEEATDLNASSIFWAVQKDLLVVRDNISEEYVFHFSKTEEQIELRDARKSNKNEGDPKLEDLSVLNKYGIYSDPITYNIDHLTSRVMVLSTEDIRLTFKKF